MYIEGTLYKEINTDKIWEIVGDESNTSWYLFIREDGTDEIIPCPEEVFVSKFEKRSD